MTTNSRFRQTARTTKTKLATLSLALWAAAFASPTALHAQGTAADDEKAKAAALAKATLHPVASLISLPLQNNFD